MKLLRKSEVMALKERERTREATEGLKIARKIDGLRELQSNTELKLNDFRNSYLRAWGDEQKKLEEQKAKLSHEVAYLQKKLSLMLPGMGTKREELAKKEKELKELSAFISQRAEELNVQEIDILDAKKELADSLARARTDEANAKSFLALAVGKDGAATAALNRAKAMENSAEWQKTRIEAQLGEKSAVLNQKERELAEKEADLSKQQQNINMEKVKLADRNAMLDRTLDRLKKARIHV